MGPVEFGYEQLVRGRLGEHLLHEWDVAVALDPAATLAPDGTDAVVDGIEALARWTARPMGPERTVTIATTAPERGFSVAIGRDVVGFSSIGPAADATLVMPAEAFVRLVYGRLDPAHTPSTVVGDGDALDQLRQVFPGL